MQKSTKMCIFDGHECKNLIKYKIPFLNKMKSLLLYLVKFFKDKFMLSKEYPNDCIMSSLDQRLIIIIIYNKSSFSTNDDYRKF